jgi:hypothetical protein
VLCTRSDASDEIVARPRLAGMPGEPEPEPEPEDAAEGGGGMETR